MLGLLKISLPTKGGLGSERRKAEGLPGGREGGEGEKARVAGGSIEGEVFGNSLKERKRLDYISSSPPL